MMGDALIQINSCITPCELPPCMITCGFPAYGVILLPETENLHVQASVCFYTEFFNFYTKTHAHMLIYSEHTLICFPHAQIVSILILSHEFSWHSNSSCSLTKLFNIWYGLSILYLDLTWPIHSLGNRMILKA